MGILKAIADAVKEKMREELIRYLTKIAEENATKAANKQNERQERRHDHGPSGDSRRTTEKHEDRRPLQREQEPRGERKTHHLEKDRYDREYHTHDYDSRDKNEREESRNKRLERYQEKYHDTFTNRRYQEEPGTVQKSSLKTPEEGQSPPPGTPLPISPQTPHLQSTSGHNHKQERLGEEKTETSQGRQSKLPSVLPSREEWVAPVNDKPIEKIQISLGTDEVTIPVDLARMIQQLPPQEYALYLKLLLYSFSIRKNYGYVGAGLKKNIGLADTDSAEFDNLLKRLTKRGLLAIEKVSEFQSTYILYLPFDDQRMKRVEEKKEEPASQQSSPPPVSQEKEEHVGKSEAPQEAQNCNSESAKSEKKKEKTKTEKLPSQKPRGKSASSSQKTKKREQPPTQQPSPEAALPGTIDISMDNDQLLKAYRTFVSMEIDKAKMRVGRSNFDKIYMEAVKYIDKKYGFNAVSYTHLTLPTIYSV